MFNNSMFKRSAKLCTIIFFIQTAIAAPGKLTVAQQVHKQLMGDLKVVYDKSSSEMSKSGLKAFIANYGNDFTEFDQAFLSTQIKGLNPLPKIEVNNVGELTMQNGKNVPIKIAIVDAKSKVFLVNGKHVKINNVDTFEEVYKKALVALEQPKMGYLWIDRVEDLVFKKAHAVETSTWIAGGIIAIAVGVILYRLGKKAGEDKMKKKMSNSGTTTTTSTDGAISEENPTYLENPGTDIPDQSSDVITPTH